MRRLKIAGMLVLVAFMATSCATYGLNKGNPFQPDFRLSPGQEYAAEIMSYLLRVVLGKAGDPRFRGEWASKGLKEPLDLDAVYRAMTKHDGDIRRYMVMDANVLDLCQTLFYYDQDLSFSRRPAGFMSMYPAAEFLALRLLFLRKMHRGQKIHMGALLRREGDLMDPAAELGDKFYEKTGLVPDEALLIRACLRRRPSLKHYLQSPFLVASLFETGVIAADAWTRNKLKHARYGEVPCAGLGRFGKGGRVKVAILPSLTRRFLRGADGGCGFEATESLRKAMDLLREGILTAAAGLLAKMISGPDDPQGRRLVRGTRGRALDWVRQQTAFAVQDRRPLVVVPENAAQVVRDVCPDADFVIILRGKRAYLAMHVDPGKDLYPAVNRLFVDLSDIEHGMAQEAFEVVARFLVARLTEPEREGD